MTFSTPHLLSLYYESARHLADLKADGSLPVLIQHEAHECQMLRLALQRRGVKPL